MSNTTDLSALRIDRSKPTPSGGRPNRIPLILGIVLLLAVAAFAVVKPGRSMTLPAWTTTRRHGFPSPR